MALKRSTAAGQQVERPLTLCPAAADADGSACRGFPAAGELGAELVAAGFTPFVGARSTDLAALHDALDDLVGVLTVPRDDNAIGIAAGASFAGGFPVVLLRDSGPGSCAEAIARVVATHSTPILFVVGVRPHDVAATADAMTRLGERVVADVGIETVTLHPGLTPADAVTRVRSIIHDGLRPAVLLVPVGTFGMTL